MPQSRSRHVASSPGMPVRVVWLTALFCGVVVALVGQATSAGAPFQVTAELVALGVTVSSTVWVLRRSTHLDRLGWGLTGCAVSSLQINSLSWIVTTTLLGRLPGDATLWTTCSAVSFLLLAVGLMCLLGGSIHVVTKRMLDSFSMVCGVMLVAWSAQNVAPWMSFFYARDVDLTTVDVLSEVLWAVAGLLVVSPAVIALSSPGVRRSARGVLMYVWAAIVVAMLSAPSMATDVDTANAPLPFFMLFLSAALAIPLLNEAALPIPWDRLKASSMEHSVLVHIVMLVGVVTASASRVATSALEASTAFLLGGVAVALTARNALTYWENHQLLVALRERELVLERRADFDDLTKLRNRPRFFEDTETFLQREFDPGKACTVAVLFIDLDGFKSINDTYGHSGGDHLLTVVASRLSTIFPDAVSVARLSGDEFAVALRNEPDVAARAAHAVATVSEDVRFNDVTLTVSASVGYCLAHYGEQGVTSEWLLNRADQAMYQAKRRGKNQAVRYVDGMVPARPLPPRTIIADQVEHLER